MLSGETGAGKSIVVDSLSLLAGARASAEMVRTGAEALTVSGVFEPEGDGWRSVLEEAGLEAEGDEVLVRREIGRSGRNRVFVNDQPTTLRLLADLAPYLLRIHGQRDELGLIEPDLQRAMLDRSGGPEAAPLLARVAEAFEQHARLAERLERLSGDDRMRRERIDLLRFQAAEIDAAKLRAGEEAELKAERDVLRNAEAITRALGTAFALLFEEEGSAVERIGQGRLAARRGRGLGAAGRGLGGGARGAAHPPRPRPRARSSTGWTAWRPIPARLDSVEERLAPIERLCRKHGGDSAAVLARRAEIEAELAELEGDAENRDELEGKVAAALAEYREAALALSKAPRGLGEGPGRTDRGGAEGPRARPRPARRGARAPPPRRQPARRSTARRSTSAATASIRWSSSSPPTPASSRGRSPASPRAASCRASISPSSSPRGARRSKAHPTLVFDEVDTGIGGAEAAALGRQAPAPGQGAGRSSP